MFTFYYTNLYTNHCIKETSIKQTKTTKQNKTNKKRERNTTFKGAHFNKINHRRLKKINLGIQNTIKYKYKSEDVTFMSSCPL
jgi:hypothetical protein